MKLNAEFKAFIRSWFSPDNQDFAESVISDPDNHKNWLIGLWYSYIYENSLCTIPNVQ